MDGPLTNIFVTVNENHTVNQSKSYKVNKTQQPANNKQEMAGSIKLIVDLHVQSEKEIMQATEHNKQMIQGGDSTSRSRKGNSLFTKNSSSFRKDQKKATR